MQSFRLEREYLKKYQQQLDRASMQLYNVVNNKNPIIPPVFDTLEEYCHHLKTEVARLTDLVLSFLQLLNTVNTIEQGCGRSFKNTFRASFIKALYNEGNGLVVSTRHFEISKASRKYTNKTDPTLMEQGRARLKSLGWDEKHLNFEDIEMDCILPCHVLSDRGEKFADPAKILMPENPTQGLAQVPFTTKLSVHSIDGELNEPNSQIVAEIASESKDLPEKLRQLEKNLQFLQLKHQMEHTGNEFTNIESIFNYAFLVIPYAPMKKADMDQLICKSILDEKDRFPLLYRLFELGRFGRFFIPSIIPESLNQSSAFSLEIHALEMKHKQLLIKEEELLAAYKQLSIKEEELLAARSQLPFDPKVQQTISKLEKELKQMILESVNNEEAI